MKILALDTSGLTASVALAEDDRLIAGFRIQHKTTHSQILMPMLDAIRSLTELDLHTIDAVAVAAGPGSFTGLRIGAATAKGLCLALDVPLIAVPTVEAMAYRFYGTENTAVCPMMDARRMQVYTGIYTFSPDSDGPGERQFRMETLYPQCACSVAALAEALNRAALPALLSGDGVPPYAPRLRELLRVPYHIAPFHQDRQDAEAVAALGMRYFREGRAIGADAFAPVYLRPSQAERVRRETAASSGPAYKTRAPQTDQTVHIHEMRAGEVAEAAALDAAAEPSEAWSAEQLAEAAARADTLYLVAQKAGKLVGLCGVQNVSGDGMITNVAVDAQHRRQHIAEKMLHRLLQQGKGAGITAFTLEVRAGNLPAVRLYEKLGFRSEGIRPGFYEHPKEDAVVYWKRPPG